jgi:hypothetical protein
MMQSWKAAAVAIACVAMSACRGLLAPVDGGADAGDAGGVSDGAAPEAEAPAEAGDGGEAGVACDDDASDEVLCAPPADDLLFANPPTIEVAAGSYGAATFVATGPWASDPSMYIWYESSTLPLLSIEQVTTYGSPQSLPFLVAQSAAGGQGTITVSGHAGNIERHATLTVNVTTCVPWAPSFVCAGQDCGLQGNGCGGLLSCGECAAPTPYCWIGHCVASKPQPCSAGDGFDPDAGACIPCTESPACNPCPNQVTMPHQSGFCISADSMCICYTQPSGQILYAGNPDAATSDE